MRTLLVLLLLLCCAAPLSAATYYIDVTNGDDTTGDGSELYPWATMSKAEASATGGDTVYLRAGTYPKFTANKLYTPVRTDYLTWKAYPGESVTIEGVDIARHWTQPTFGGFTCYMAFDGFHIHETTTDTGSVVAMAGARYVQFLNCTIHGFRDPEAGTSSSYALNSRENRDVLIENCDISEAHFVVYLWGWDMTLRNCKVHGAHEDAVRIINAINILVEDCEIYDVGEGDDLHNDGLQWFSSDSGAAEQKVPCENVVIRRCRIHDIEDQDILGNYAPFGRHVDFVFENLLLEPTDTWAYELTIGDTEAVVRNCTVIGSFRFQSNGYGDVRNCIANTMLWESGSVKVYEDYNCFGSLSGMTAGDHTLVGYDPSYLDADNGNYSLSPDSPCIDAGISTDSAELDYNNMRRIDTAGVENTGGGDDAYYDMGAFEYQGAAGGQLCSTLSVTTSNLGSGSGTITITADGYYEATLREDRSGAITNFYDLTADASKTRNLSSDGMWSDRLIDARYFTYFLFRGMHSGRTLSVVYSDAQMVIVKVAGTQQAASGVYMPLEAYYTFHAPIYEGSFVDLEVYVENDTSTTYTNNYMYVNLTVPSDPSGYTFDWEGAGYGTEPGDRWIMATVGDECTVPNVAIGRSFKYTELTLPSAGAAPDLTPPGMNLRGPASYSLAPGEVFYDHFVLETNIVAVPSLFVYDDDSGTGSGTVTITCPKFYEFVFDESVGSGIRYFYDLRVDPFRKVNLADATWYNPRMFDIRVHYNQYLHVNNTGNRLSVVTEDTDQVVLRCTGSVTVSGYPIDTQTDYTFTPPGATSTDIDISVTLTNNNGIVVGTSSSDFVNLQVAPNPSGYTFDWQGTVDSDADDHWLMATSGGSATVTPLTSGIYLKLQEFSYGNIAATDSTPINMYFRFGSAAYAVDEVRVRDFTLSTNIADD